MTTYTHHMSLNIAGFLRNNKFPHGFDIFQHDDGREMSPGAALTFLTLEQAKGHKVIPVSLECEGFDYFGGGCPGHEVAE